ncbi:MAG TPA: hypothetical protein VHX65_15845 [Pirellulales bacterium]|jgi:hypothetical protein|nr:hypothetical protein [Pirellulales bacterium]
MSIKHRLRNPFYALAMVLGLLFTITTCADAVLMMKTNRAGAMPRPGEPGYELMTLLDRHGTEILVGELAALGLCTVAAIRLDHVRDRRKFARRQEGNRSETGGGAANADQG